MESNTLINDSELTYLARQLLAKYKENLYIEGVPASGKLTTDADAYIKVEGEHVCVYFSLQDYWKYVEYGRQPGGRFPPPDKIMQWIKIKPIIPRPGKNGKVPSLKQLAYLISRKIVVEGIKPKNVLSNTLRENENTLVSAFANKVAELLEIEALNIIDTL